MNDEISPADVSVELTKTFRGLRIWLPLQMFGLKPFRTCLEEKILLTEYFYKSVQKIGYNVGPVPQLTVVIFHFITKEGVDVDAVYEELLEMVLFYCRVLELIVFIGFDVGLLFLGLI